MGKSQAGNLPGGKMYGWELQVSSLQVSSFNLFPNPNINNTDEHIRHEKRCMF